MKLTGFNISNFKGIRSAKIRFSDHDTARVHTLVGLNESGKTTLLEAMHSFSPDVETQLVVKSARSVEEQREQWVPRDQISIFTGEVRITAYVSTDANGWRRIRSKLKSIKNLVTRNEDFPNDFTVQLVHTYKNGDFQHTVTNINLPSLRVKTPRAKNWRKMRDNEINFFRLLVRRALPTVAYYPTFVFDFPKKIYLTGRDTSAKNRFYKQLFQDILDYDGRGYTIEESIVARLHKEETAGVWEQWFSAFVGTTEEDKVKQVISRAERAVTDLVFSKWTEVFGEDVGAKEIAIDLQYEKGEIVEDEAGVEYEPEEHDAYISFRIKDGSSLYSVEDRSLGFRWFFSFLLFTQFRVRRDEKQPTIFLFDEPASNLHAAAQKKLLESFPAIAKSPHRLIYSTHSHYMVDPRWLEQAYIVFDGASEPDSRIIDEGVKPDSSVDIQAVPYRQFIQDKPNQTSYFQPILDTLEVQPSHFDYNVGGLIVEGKGDYYFLKVCVAVAGKDIGPIFPAKGSGTMSALVSLHRGWGLPVRVLFDSDRGGRDGRKSLKSEFGLTNEEYNDLKTLVPSLNKIEDLFSDKDQSSLSGGTTKEHKSVMLRRVQEFLAADELPTFTKETQNRMTSLVNAVEKFLNGTPD